MDDPDEPTERSGLVAGLYRYRTVLAAAAAVWFALLMIGGIFLSQLDARLGLNVFGPQIWVAGEPAAVRIALRQLRFDRIEPLARAEARLLDADGHEVGRWSIDQRAGDLVQGQVTPPAAGNFTLQIHAAPPQGALSVSVPITAVATAPPTPLPAGAERRPPPKPDRGPVKLEVRPTDHVLAGNLPGRLTVRAMDERGQPVEQATVALQLREGKSARPLPPEITTDAHGLAELVILPRHPVFWLELTAPESFATRRMKHLTTQFAMVVPKRVVPPATRLPIGIKGLHRSGALFVDLWHGDRWLSTTTATLEDGEARLMLPLPEHLPEDPAVVWLQAYRAPYLPGQARGGVHVLVTRKDPTTATRLLARELAERGLDPLYTRHLSAHASAHPTLSRYLLGLPGRPDADPPLLADSSESARQTIGNLKWKWQLRFVVALLGTGLLLFVVLLLVVRQNYRDVQRRWIEAGGDEEAAIGTRRHILIEAAYIFFILAIFLAGLVNLVLTIRW